MFKDFCTKRCLTRRRLLRTGGLALGGLSLSSLTPGAPMVSLARARQEAATIEWWIQESRADYIDEAVIQPFEADNPSIVLETEPIGGDISDINLRISTALQAGTGPDIMFSGGVAESQQLAQAGLLLNLDPYATEFDWQNKLLPWALDVGRLDGNLYILPDEFECTLTFYGQKQFDENGWTPPTTRQEFEDLATDAMGKGIIPVALGTSDCTLCTTWLTTIFYNHYAGPDALFQALTGEIQFSDPVFVDAITLLNQYMQAGWFGGGVDQYFSTSFDTTNSQIADGSAAMSMAGTFFISDVDSFFGEEAGNDNAWGWFQNPSFREEVPFPLYPIGLGATLAIAADSEHPDEAALFIDWYYSDPARIGQRVATFGNEMAVPVPYQDSDFPETLDPRVRDMYSSLSEATSTGGFGYVNWTFLPPKSYLYDWEQIQKVFTNQLTPVDFCKGLAEVFTEELEAGVVPPIIPRQVS